MQLSEGFEDGYGVIIEIITIPLSFSLYFTLIFFSVINLLLLRVRIEEESKAWSKNRV